MVCRKFGKNIIHVEITVGQYIGNQVFLPRISLSSAENEGYHFHFKKKKFPILLYFAMTINEIQGQTIPNVSVYLSWDIFSHGQLYVALLRGISTSTIKVLVKTNMIKKKKKEKEHKKHVVHKEVLLPQEGFAPTR